MDEAPYKRRRPQGNRSLLACLLVLLFALIFSGIAVGTALDTYELYQSGERVEGTVAGLRSKRSSSRGRHGRSKSVRYAVVEYTTKQGETLKEEFNTEGFFFSSYERGDTVEVAYDPNEPSRMCIIGWGNWTFTVIFGAVGLVIFALWCKLIIAYVKER